jgi:predicted Zn-dependent protease
VSVVETTADRALAIALDVLKRDGRAGEVHVDVTRFASANVRFARNEVTTGGESDETTTKIGIALGKRHANAETNQGDDASLRSAAERVLAMAKLAPEDPEQMALLPRQTYATAPSAWDDGVASMAAGDRAAIAGRAIAQGDAQKVQIAGFFDRHGVETALRNSNGLAAAHRHTTAQYTVTARTPDGTGSGWGGAESHRIADIDDGAIARTAIEKGLRSAKPRALEAGKYTVVLEPVCVQEMLTFLIGAMNARSADEGRSFFANKLGTKVAADFVSLTSDPLDPATPGAPFDGEGIPLRRHAWLENGVAKALAVSRFWAAKKGTQPTGHHSVFRLSGGNAESIDDLVKGVKRGLLVTRFWYTRMLEPQSVTLTGLTRDGVFLVEDGKLAAPVTNFRWNESPVRVLANAEAMTKRTFRVPTFGGAWHVPAVRTREFTMASTSAAV